MISTKEAAERLGWTRVGVWKRLGAGPHDPAVVEALAQPQRCEVCDRPFERTGQRHYYCSEACRERGKLRLR